MALARGLDFLSTWIVSPKLELEANPLMRRAGFIRMALTILTKSFQEQRAAGTAAGSLWMVPAEGTITAQRDCPFKLHKTEGRSGKVR